MKKSISVLFSAIALSLAILTMSCSRNESPIADDTQEWVQLNMAIDSLTEVYTSSMSYKPAVDTINNEKEDQTTLHVAEADARGALDGAVDGYSIGGAVGAIVGAIVEGALQSFQTWMDETSEEIVIDHLGGDITSLGTQYDGAQVGWYHNVILQQLLQQASVQPFSSDSELVAEIVSLCEEQSLPMANNIKTYYLSLAFMNSTVPSDNVSRTCQNYIRQAYTVPRLQMHQYTTDYLNEVASTITNSYDRLRLTCYASVAYYSRMFWHY